MVWMQNKEGWQMCFASFKAYLITQKEAIFLFVRVFFCKRDQNNGAIILYQGKVRDLVFSLSTALFHTRFVWVTPYSAPYNTIWPHWTDPGHVKTHYVLSTCIFTFCIFNLSYVWLTMHAIGCMMCREVHNKYNLDYLLNNILLILLTNLLWIIDEFWSGLGLLCMLGESVPKWRERLDITNRK